MFGVVHLMQLYWSPSVLIISLGTRYALSARDDLLPSKSNEVVLLTLTRIISSTD